MLSFLFPSSCLNCGLLGAYVCLSCRRRLQYVSFDRCMYCGGENYLGLTHIRCRKKYGVDGVLSIFHYSPELKRIVSTIKYKFVTDAWKDVLFSIRADKMSRFGEFFRMVGRDAAFQEIPLHPSRKRERGFNQATTIRRFFQLFHPIPAVDTLIRGRNTGKQAQLHNVSKRKRNMLDSFLWSARLPYRYTSVILVDDVITTGATIREAAHTCKLNGIERVYAVSLARG